MKTLGHRITALKPVGGFAAETAAACSLYLATALGVPVSTTHTITGAIVGVGATRRLSAVRWGVAGRIVWAWVLTIPAAGVVAAIVYVVTVSRTALTAAVLIAAAAGVTVRAVRRAAGRPVPAEADAEAAVGSPKHTADR